jgi:hypothetical protein
VDSEKRSDGAFFHAWQLNQAEVGKNFSLYLFSSFGIQTGKQRRNFCYFSIKSRKLLNENWMEKMRCLREITKIWWNRFSAVSMASDILMEKKLEEELEMSSVSGLFGVEIWKSMKLKWSLT